MNDVRSCSHFPVCTCGSLTRAPLSPLRGREAMHESGNTILITGGATGIGKALATRFLAASNTVIVCGRDREKLDEAKKETPGLHVLYTDVSNEGERVQLYEAVTSEFPKPNAPIT